LLPLQALKCVTAKRIPTHLKYNRRGGQEKHWLPNLARFVTSDPSQLVSAPPCILLQHRGQVRGTILPTLTLILLTYLIVKFNPRGTTNLPSP